MQTGYEKDGIEHPAEDEAYGSEIDDDDFELFDQLTLWEIRVSNIIVYASDTVPKVKHPR